MHVVLDACVIIFSYVLAWYLRFKSGLFQQDPWFLSLHEYMGALLYIVPGYLMLYYLFQLYTPKRVRGRRLEAWNILQANTIVDGVHIRVVYYRASKLFQKNDRDFFLREYCDRDFYEKSCAAFSAGYAEARL